MSRVLVTALSGVVETEAEFTAIIRGDAPADIFTRAEADEFQSALYGDSVRDKDTVLEHWAYNAAFNGVRDASRLDGWGDLEQGMVTFRIFPIHLELGPVDEQEVTTDE